ncbi:MAG: hypothetical protein KKD92_10450 [Proteobacteria bacterium]|nr:hypothetical protein [Pseudomonadota bacterium]
MKHKRYILAFLELKQNWTFFKGLITRQFPLVTFMLSAFPGKSLGVFFLRGSAPGKVFLRRGGRVRRGRDTGKTCLEDIAKGDVESFLAHEQDRGLKITSVRTRLMYVHTFLRYGIDEGFVSTDVFGRRARLQLPKLLPRAMDPGDVRQLLSVIGNIRTGL